MKKRISILLSILMVCLFLASCKDKAPETSELESYAKLLNESVQQVSSCEASMTLTDSGLVVYKKKVVTTVDKETRSAQVETTVYSYDSSFSLTSDTSKTTVESYDSEKLIGFTLTDEVVKAYTLKEGILTFELAAGDAEKFFGTAVSSTTAIVFTITTENEKITDFSYSYTMPSGRACEVITTYTY